MRFPIRLYRNFDMDLIYLRKHPNFDFVEAVRQCLYAYFVSKEPFWIEVPEPDDGWKKLQELEREELFRELPYATQVAISLNADQYGEVIRRLGDIPRGRRNSFIRSILRASLLNTHSQYFFWFYFSGDTDAGYLSSTQRKFRSFYCEQGRKTKKKRQQKRIDDIDEYIREVNAARDAKLMGNSVFPDVHAPRHDAAVTAADIAQLPVQAQTVSTDFSAEAVQQDDDEQGVFQSYAEPQISGESENSGNLDLFNALMGIADM